MLPTWRSRCAGPDGSCFEGEGLQPDVIVACTPQDLEHGDPILEQALAILRKKAAK
jgi:hypothetical protein